MPDPANTSKVELVKTAEIMIFYRLDDILVSQ